VINYKTQVYDFTSVDAQWFLVCNVHATITVLNIFSSNIISHEQ